MFGMTTLKDIVRHLNLIAPESYTFRGLMNRVEIGPQTEKEQDNTTVNRVLVVTYPSARAVTKATQDKVNLLISHHPILAFPTDRLEGNNLLRIRLLTKNYISTFVLRSPWVAARNGLTDAFVGALGLETEKDFEIPGDVSPLVPIGRICRPPSVMNHSGFVNFCARKMESEQVVFTGGLDQDVDRILIIAGSSVDRNEVKEAKRLNISTLVTGELTPEVRWFAKEQDVNTLELGSIVTEEPGMRQLKGYLSLEFPDLKIGFFASEPIERVLRPYSKDVAK